MAEFYKKKLGNGLTVLFEKRNLPVISISSTINFGSAFESKSQKGLSHFMEHLMFKGTKTRSHEELVREVEKKGGILNAYTSEEVTSYWDKLPSNHWLSGLNISSDLILNPKFDAVEFEREKGVIIEEIKMYHDDPRSHVLNKIKELLYKKPFGMSVAGNEENIRKATKADILKLFNKNYTTDSMILTAVGNIKFDEFCKEAEKLFPNKERDKISYIPLKINKEETEKRKGIDQAHFVFGFHAPTLDDIKRYDYDIAGAYLFEGMSSVLFQEIREKRALAYAVKGDFDLGRNYGYGMIYVGTMKDKINKIKEIILKEIKDVRNLQKKDFEECKEQLIGQRKVEEEDSINTMNSLMMEEIGGDAKEYYNYNNRINSVKLEDVRSLARLKNFSTFSLVPAD